MKNINTITPFEQLHFDETTVIVDRAGIDTDDEIGLILTDAQIIGLSGAPRGSKITLAFYPASYLDEDEEVPAGLYFEMENPTYIRSKNVVGIFKDGPTGFAIYIKSVDFIPGRVKNLAARMLAIIVRWALKIPGITRLNLLAAGGRTWNYLDPLTKERWGGFVAWPKYGFDMRLIPRTLRIAHEFPYIPTDVIYRLRVSEVLQLPQGREYWSLVGDGWYMDFDLSSKTTHAITTLDSFLGRAGI